jgi:hypothetical protein
LLLRLLLLRLLLLRFGRRRGRGFCRRLGGRLCRGGLLREYACERPAKTCDEENPCQPAKNDGATFSVAAATTIVF